MAIDILDLLKSEIGGKVAGQLGKQFGESEDATKSGIAAMIPTILGGLLKQVSAPGGADQLDKTLSEGGYDGGILDNLSDMFSGGGTDAIRTQGGGLVSMLFGDKAKALTPIIAKLTGMKPESIASMLAIVAPLVMSFLGKQKKTMGLDTNGLAGLITSQKSAIGAALPPGVSDALGLGALGISSPAPKSPATTSASGEGRGFIYVLIVLGILGALGYAAYSYIFAGIRPSGPEGNIVILIDPPESTESTEPTESNEQPIVEPTPDFTTVIQSLSSSLEKVTDVESAKAALSELELADKLLGSLTSGPSAPRGSDIIRVAQSLKATMPDLQALIDKVMAIPGVKEVLQPIIDSVMTKVKSLAGA